MKFPRYLVLLLLGPLAGSASAVTVIQVNDTAGLEAAILSVPDGGVIELAAGTYSTPAGDSFRITNPDKRFTIRAATSGTAILDGGGSFPVLQYRVSDPSRRGWVVFEGLTFRNGLAVTAGTAGGVTVSDGRATFIDCVFDSNSSQPVPANSGGSGGGVGLVTGSIAKFIDCLWTDNTSTSQAGGLMVSTSRAFVHNSQFLRNLVNIPGHRVAANGGAIFNFTSELRVSNSRFEGNEAGFAGGAITTDALWNDIDPSPQAETIIVNSTFVGNFVERDPGTISSAALEGGALHGEEQVLIRIYNSRFISNTAELGGAVSSFSAVVEIYSSVFLGNLAMRTTGAGGWGGAIKLVSDDTTLDGSINRPTAALVVRDSFFQCRFGAVTEAAQIGGAIFATGDAARMFGEGAVPAMGTLADNRMPVTIDNTIFADCDIGEFVAGQPNDGGGIHGGLVDLTLTDSLFIGCDANGAGGRGGAGAFSSGSRVAISGTTFAGSVTEFAGGALYAVGSELDLDGNNFWKNEVVELLGGKERGAAIYTEPQASRSLNMLGSINNSLFVEDDELTLYDLEDLAGGVINDVQYDGNQIFSTTFGADIYTHACSTCVGGSAALTMTELNSFVVDRGTSTTDKSPSSNNSELASAPSAGALLAVPPQILSQVAAGDTESETESYLGYAWCGDCAELDGATLGAKTGFETAAIMPHSLEVFDNPSCSGSAVRTLGATISSGATPSASLTLSPIAIMGGETSTLMWSTSAGTFLDGEIDQDVGTLAAASGSMVLSPDVTTTYNMCVITQEGGVAATASVFVDEPPPDFIFSDGFESGNTLSWSVTTP